MGHPCCSQDNTSVSDPSEAAIAWPTPGVEEWDLAPNRGGQTRPGNHSGSFEINPPGDAVCWEVMGGAFEDTKSFVTCSAASRYTCEDQCICLRHYLYIYHLVRQNTWQVVPYPPSSIPLLFPSGSSYNIYLSCIDLGDTQEKKGWPHQQTVDNSKLRSKSPEASIEGVQTV